MLYVRDRIAIVGASMLALASAPAQRDPLPSWNAGSAKQAILDFVRATTDSSSPGYVLAGQRIATFDNDGTLWTEQPLPVQAVFALARVTALAPEHPAWKTTEPFRTILSGDAAAVARLTQQQLANVLAATHAGMPVDRFQKIVTDWLAVTRDARFGRRYTELVYQPMLEVLALLRANGFRTYIVSGGGQEFMRAFAEQAYGVPPEQVIGSAGRTRYDTAGGAPRLVKLPELLLVDDGPGKPVAINLFIGRRALAAFGNSAGDQQMLEWVEPKGAGGGKARLALLIHHDDARREFPYGPAATVGRFTDQLAAEARARGWIVVSMKDDWRRVFPFDAP